MKRSATIMISAASGVVLLAAGTAAGAAIAGPVDGSGAIHGCYTNKALNGSHVLVLQDAGTTCPAGTTAISWNQQGPAGPAGATGPAGPAGPKGDTGAQGLAGATGPAGPAGPAGAVGPPGPKGDKGDTGAAGAPGAGATVASLASGDPNCATGGASVTDGNGKTAYACNGATGPQGPKGDTGATGLQGPPGPSGTVDGAACRFPGGFAGTIQVSTDGSGHVTLTCQGDCTHFAGMQVNGHPVNYTDCSDALGTPGDPSTYSNAMVADVTFASENALGISNAVGSTGSCGGFDALVVTANDGTGTVITWAVDGPLAGYVDTSTSGSSVCPTTSSPTWN